MSHQYGPAWQSQPPARSNTAWSVVWALVPLLTCGIGTPFVIGHAARRLRSLLLAIAAVLYGLGIGIFMVAATIYGSSDNIPVVLDTIGTIGLFGSWIGGLGHALILRGRSSGRGRPGNSTPGRRPGTATSRARPRCRRTRRAPRGPR